MKIRVRLRMRLRIRMKMKVRITDENEGEDLFFTVNFNYRCLVFPKSESFVFSVSC